MAKIKLTKSAVDAAQPQAKAIELRDTVVPGFLCKITPAGRKVFMLQYHTNASERRKPALGQYGELTVDQARTMAQEWLAEVSVTQAAAQLGVTRAYLSRILHGHAGISADMALRLSDLLGTSPEMWLGIQSAYDLWQAAQQPRPVVLRMVAA